MKVQGSGLEARGTGLRNSVTAATLVAAVVVSATLAAQMPERLDNQLRAIYERNEYQAESAGQTAWLDGGTRYTALTRGQQRDLVAYDAGTSVFASTSTSEAPVPVS